MAYKMKPFEHIQRAEVLVAAVDARFDDNGKSQAMWAGPQVGLMLAQVHLELAHMKMIGGGRR